LLDLPLDVAMRRRGRPADRMENRPAEYHERVRLGFLAEAARRPERIHIIVASPPIEVVQEAIRRAVEAVLTREG
jgi:dTMP kinase